MLEVHRCRQIEWSPSAVVALATSVNGAAVAAAREDGSIEIWNVAAGSVGWHCQLRIPGRQDAVISSLVWCRSQEKDAAPLGRLFSAGLDGFVTEWDLHTLQPKAVVESMGGSVWQLAAEHMARTPNSMDGTIRSRDYEDEESKSEDEESSSGSDSDEEQEKREQRVALACEDGCMRIFEVADAHQGMVYRRSFPRVKGRILSVAWTWDNSRLVAGGSDGCIRCWDVATAREVYRITAGIGGKGRPSELCIWSLLTLRNGDIVSGDSSGSTQFWDGQLGTLLQVQTRHGADVLALAASPSDRTVFAAGADGQVIQFQQVDQSGHLTEEVSASESIDVTTGGKWVYVGGKRTHTHDVRALAVAFPIVDAGASGQKKQGRKWRVKSKGSAPSDYKRWAQAQTSMLISGGNDAKLFAYPAHGFLSFHPHDVCPAPERPYIQLAHQSAIQGGTLMMAQHATWVDVWKMHTNESAALHSSNGNNLENGHSVLGKRKWEGDSDDGSLGEEQLSNGHTGSEEVSKALVKFSNGHVSKRSGQGKPRGKNVGKAQGTAPALLARIKCKSAEHILCSAMSGNGRLVAFSDSQRPRLYALEQQVASADVAEQNLWDIKRRKLPKVLRGAHCMDFSADSTFLLVAGPQGLIWVVDTKSTEVVHTFQIPSHDMDSKLAGALVRIMCTSPDGQWLAAATSSGHVVVFNMEIMRHQWTVPVLDGTPATAMVFHPGGNNVLIVSSAANQIHALDVEMKAPGEWSKRNGARVAKKLLEFPGGITGLSLPPSAKATSIIAYSSSAMCHIDFSKPVPEEVPDHPVEAYKEVHPNGKSPVHANGNGKTVDANTISRSSSRNSNNFVVVPMKSPVLFLGHTSSSSVLVVEKPWLEVLRQFPAPIFRHVYGS